MRKLAYFTPYIMETKKLLFKEELICLKFWITFL
nr:MAG TPA: hypothetical protein [Caudoviricetes sp.]